MKKSATIELCKEYLKFSAAHFTIFSATERERLHGHNFAVSARFDAPVDNNGLSVDYAILKSRLRSICEHLDEYLLLPGKSPYLSISEEGDYYRVSFQQQRMQFLVADTRILPVANISVEELADYVLQALLDDETIGQCGITAIAVSVSSGPGQWGRRSWHAGQAGSPDG